MSERRKLIKDDPIWDWWAKAERPADICPIVMTNGSEVEELSGGC